MWPSLLPSPSLPWASTQAPYHTPYVHSDHSTHTHNTETSHSHILSSTHTLHITHQVEADCSAHSKALSHISACLRIYMSSE